MAAERPRVDPNALRAVTRRCDHAVDLLEVAGSSGILFERGAEGFAGRGLAAAVPRAEIGAFLAAVAADDELGVPGSGPVAFGALPFVPSAPADLLVPALTVARASDGTRWATAVGPVDGPPPDPLAALAALPAREPAGPGPSAFDVRDVRPPAEWMDAVADATARIRAGRLDKVVLSREIVVTADVDHPIPTILERLRQTYPGCFVFLVEGFLGASPELLVARRGDLVRAQPLAGTVPRRGDPEEDARLARALFVSPTYRHEHAVAIDVVHDTLLEFSSYIDDEPEPSILPLANVQHLATTVEGRLSHPPASVMELVDALHPTPAVCGRPREAALEVIAELEGFDRGHYAGAVGWVDAAGNGQWAIGIRSATVDGPVARVVAGNGMVGDSDPPTELAETRAKFQAMLSALVRP